jgi:hypothetical protein
MAHQSRFQVFTQNTRLVYLSRGALDEFHTKKLLGMKIISVEAEGLSLKGNCTIVQFYPMQISEVSGKTLEVPTKLDTHYLISPSGRLTD